MTRTLLKSSGDKSRKRMAQERITEIAQSILPIAGLFAVISFAFFFGLVAAVTLPLLEKTTQQMNADAVAAEADAKAAYLNRYFEDHAIILADLASSAVVTKSIMLSEVTPDLIDLFGYARILGSKRKLTLFDFEGNILYATDPLATQTDVQSFADVYNGGQSFAFSIEDRNGDAVFLIIVPVRYNQTIEGALMMSLDTTLDTALPAAALSGNRVVSIEKNGVDAVSKGGGGQVYLTHARALEMLGAVMKLRVDQSEFLASKKNAQQRLFASIILITIVSFGLFVAIGYRTLIRPYRALAQTQNSLVERTGQLQESEVRYELAVQGAGAGIWDWNVLTNDLYWSPRFADILGVSKEGFVPNLSEFEDRLHTDDHGRVMDLLAQHLEHGTPYDTECRLRRGDGAYIWIRARGQAIWDDDGVATRMAGSAEDISDKKIIEIELKNHAALLAQSNKELEQFAYVASHDLRAPLRGMDNLAGWIAEDLGDSAKEGIGEKLDLLRGRVMRMDTILKDILAFSRAGKNESEPEQINLMKLVDEVISDINAPASMKIDVQPNLPTLFSSHTGVWHIFLNLISNAVKHHDRLGGSVSISAKDIGDFYQFSIVDDGPGIPEEFQDRVFQMFQKLKRRDEIEGSGIGLAIVHKMVGALGGSITLQSPVTERGSAFYFTIPKTPPASYAYKDTAYERPQNRHAVAC